MKKARRQPMSGAKRAGLRTRIEAPAPSAAPIQNEPLIARSMRPRRRAGMNSWIVELIALYSPPMPAPVRKRNRQKLIRSKLKAVAAVAAV